MSWSALEIEASQFKEREAALFGSEDDATVIAYKKTVAKEQMYSDITDELQLHVVNDAAKVDTLATDYATDLKRALAFLQLHLWFVDNDNGEGSVNRFKADHYKEQYENERARFKTLGDYALSRSTNVVSAWR